MESPRKSCYLSLCVFACVVVCFACSLTASAAAPTRMAVPRGAGVPGSAREEKHERSPSVPQKEPAREKDGMGVPTYPPEMKDEAPKSYMPVISAVPQKEKEGQSQGRVIVLPEKQRRKTMPYSQMMVPRETIVYKEEDGKMYTVVPEEEDAYQSEPKPVVVEEEETYYPKTYLKTVTPKISARAPMKVQHKTDKMEIMKNIEQPTKTYVLVQAMEMEDQTPSVMVETMSPMDIYPAFTVPKKNQYVKIPQMREDMDSYQTYMKMKAEEKAHQQHSDCGGMPCYTPQQVCEVPPCKVPSICPDCGTMKVVPSAAPIDAPMPHGAVEKGWSGFMQRYVDSRQNMVAAPPAKIVKEQAPRYKARQQAPCAYGTDCMTRQYEEDVVYHTPSVSGCKVEIHPVSSTPIVDCSPMASASYGASPSRQYDYSPEKDQMGMPSESAPRWATPSMPVPVHELERMPVPMHPPQGGMPAEEWKMPAAPPAPVPGMEMGMPWAKGGSSAPQEKIPESFRRRRSYYYYYYPSSGSRERVVEVYYPSAYTYPRWQYMASYPPSYSYSVPAMSPVEYYPATVSDPVPIPQRTVVSSSSKAKKPVGKEYDHVF